MSIDTTPKHPLAASLIQTLAAALRSFDGRSRRRLFFLLILMIGGAALEALAAAVIVPFIAVINDPASLSSHPQLRELFLLSGAKTPTAFITTMSLVLLGCFLSKNAYLFLMTKAQFRFIYTQMPLFSCELFSSYLARPLSDHVQTNSAEMIRNVSNEVSMFFTNFLIPAMTLLTEALVMVALLTVLLWMAPLPTLVALVVLGGMMSLFYRLVRTRVRHFGTLQQRHNAERIKWVNQGLGSIKETKVLGRESYFIQQFRYHEGQFAQSAEYAMLLNQTPRLFIETITFAALFLGVAAALLIKQDPSSVLPVLALFAVAAVRLLPSLNRIMLSITRMAYYRPAAAVVLEAYREREQQAMSKRIPKRDVGEWQELKFEDVAFSYPDSTEVLFKLNLSIRRGTSVALIGPSGCGKTTVADLALGLLHPTGGRILLDQEEIQSLGDGWRSRLGYIPQTIYLLDDSIRRNVAFGLPDDAIDDEKVWQALRMAQLEDHILGLPDQLETPVGENGGKLSGGQRQRLGIARALYNDPDFIVMDEATSALDEATEKEFADTMEKLRGQKTLLVIAHRPETINRCDYRFRVDQKALVS